MPWMSQKAIERLEDRVDAGYALASQIRAEKDARIADLTQTIIDLRRQGFTPRDPEPRALEIRPPSAVDLALRELPVRVRGQVAGAAQLWVQQGMSQTDAALRIQMGEDAWANREGVPA